MAPQAPHNQVGTSTSTDETSNDLREPLLSSDNADNDNDRPEVPPTADAGTANSTNDKKNIVMRKCCGKRGNDGDADADADDANVLFRVNHNVFLNLSLSVLYGISASLWSGTAYVAFLKKMGHGSNGPVGDIEAVSGLASLLCALPIGYLADTMGRSVVIRAGGILLFVTAMLQIGILEWVGTDFGNDDDDVDDDPSSNSNSNKSNVALWLMGAIMVFWGLGDGVVNGPCQALYADSTPEGERSMYFTYQFACYLSASAVGPVVSIIMFQTLGDEWDMYHLRIVIYVGLGMEVFNALLMMLFDDSKALETDDDDDDDNDDGNVSGDENESDAIGDDNNNNPSDQPAAAEGQVAEDESSSLSSSPSQLTPLQKRQQWIPYLVFISGLISSLGSGMTVKFFPLFFKDEVGMTPSQVQLIYVLVPLVMVVLGALCTKIAGAGLGRVQTTALYNVGGISLLLCMVSFKSFLDAHPFYLVPIYVFRTGLMNATYPLTESILMDFVPKGQRARWKSLDSVASFGWCGSAAFGGWLADKYDYTHTFLVTAIFQIVALGVWCCLLPLVPREEGTRSSSSTEDLPPTENERGDNSEMVNGGEDALTELSEPLL
jgi:MFS family permease